MSAQITRKQSDDHKAPLPPPPPGVLADRENRPVGKAPLLSSWSALAPEATHGTLPELPAWPRGFVDLGPLAALRVTGPDRESWLQGVQTADVKSAREGGAVHTLFLGGKGRTVAEGLVWRLHDELLVTVRPDRLEALHAHCDKLLIMEDAELSRAEGLHRLRWAPGGSAALEAAATPAQREALEGIRGAPLELGFELLVAEAQAQRLLAAFPDRPAPEALEAWRIALGVPEWSRDFDDDTTPLEAGLDGCISFDKGCYVGQEVIAMATYRGRVQWNLVRLVVDGAPPAIGSALEPARGGKGRVTSAAAVGARALLLGVVHRERIVPGSTVPLADGRVAAVLGLPLGSRPGAGVCA